METAKVDIRKLQLLNDRINQCIDALNQVRLSVHGAALNAGLSHTGGLPGIAGPGIQTGYGGYGQTPLGFVPGAGLSHSGSIGNPFVTGGMSPGMSQGINPFLAQGSLAQAPLLGNPYFAQRAQGYFPQGAQGIPQGVQGLSHTPGAWGQQGSGFPSGYPVPFTGAFGAEGINDPLLTARIAQTFPYAQFPVPPVVTLY